MKPTFFREVNQVSTLRFPFGSTLFRRSLGKLRQMLGAAHIFKITQLERLKKYYEDRVAYFNRKKQQKMRTQKKHTVRSLVLYATRLKQMFKDLTDDSANTPTIERNACVTRPSDKAAAIFEKLSNWVPSMMPGEVEQPLFGSSALAQVRSWTTFQIAGFPQELRDELTVKHSETIWSDVLAPITLEDFKNACKNRRGGPGASRITYRMLLYTIPFSFHITRTLFHHFYIFDPFSPHAGFFCLLSDNSIPLPFGFLSCAERGPQTRFHSFPLNTFCVWRLARFHPFLFQSPERPWRKLGMYGLVGTSIW